MHGGHSAANWEVIYWHWDYLTYLGDRKHLNRSDSVVWPYRYEQYEKINGDQMQLVQKRINIGLSSSITLIYYQQLFCDICQISKPAHRS